MIKSIKCFFLITPMTCANYPQTDDRSRLAEREKIPKMFKKHDGEQVSGLEKERNWMEMSFSAKLIEKLEKYLFQVIAVNTIIMNHGHTVKHSDHSRKDEHIVVCPAEGRNSYASFCQMHALTH